MGNGEWGMGNGEWGMGNGEWGMGNGDSIAVAGSLSTVIPAKAGIHLDGCFESKWIRLEQPFG